MAGEKVSVPKIQKGVLNGKARRQGRDRDRRGVGVREGDGEPIFVKADVSKPADAKEMVKLAVDAWGRVDILFNNAGVLGPWGVNTAEYRERDAEKLIAVNFKGVFYGTKYATPAMIRSGGGSIITTGSDSAFLGNRGLSVDGGWTVKGL